MLRSLRASPQALLHPNFGTVPSRWRADKARDRFDVADKNKRQVAAKGRAYGVGGRADEKRVTVGGRSNDGFSRDVSAGARSIFNDEARAETRREPLGNHARNDIRCPTCGIYNNNMRGLKQWRLSNWPRTRLEG